MANPTTQIKIGNVPFSNDYKHVIKYADKTTQTKKLQAYLTTYTSHNINIIRKNEPFIIYDNSIDLTNCNYLCYNNRNISNKWYYAFIERVEYNANNTIKIYHSCDVWQTYQFDIDLTLKNKIIRGHILKSLDVIGDYTEREPVGFSANRSALIFSSSLDWSPLWNINTVSRYGVGTGKVPFYYGGYQQTTTNATGGYMWPTSTLQNIETFLSVFRDTEIFQKSHLDEVINLTCVPAWCESNARSKGYIDLDSTVEQDVYKTNAVCIDAENVNAFTVEHIACGYVPKNKKCYTSLCNTFVLWNLNGLNIPLKPELFYKTIRTGESLPMLYYSMRPINNNSIKCELMGYESNDRYINIPYGASLGIGYNSNQGLSNFTNKISAIGGTVSGAIGGFAISGGNPAGAVVGGVVGAVNNVSNVTNAFDSQFKQLGSCSDVTGVSSENIRLKMSSVSPNYNECKIIDDYLTMYGYALNTIDTISNYINTRSNWNYIQTSDVNIKCNCTNDDIQTLKNMFNSGVTFWHKNYGDYSQSNN